MTLEEKEKFENYFDLFLTKGWKQFAEYTEEVLKASVETAPDYCETNDQWQIRRGQIDILKQVVGFETFIRESHKYAEEEEYGDNP